MTRLDAAVRRRTVPGWRGIRSGRRLLSKGKGSGSWVGSRWRGGAWLEKSGDNTSWLVVCVFVWSADGFCSWLSTYDIQPWILLLLHFSRVFLTDVIRTLKCNFWKGPNLHMQTLDITCRLFTNIGWARFMASLGLCVVGRGRRRRVLWALKLVQWICLCPREKYCETDWGKMWEERLAVGRMLNTRSSKANDKRICAVLQSSGGVVSLHLISMLRRRSSLQSSRPRWARSLKKFYPI